jgi:hypothetical protein
MARRRSEPLYRLFLNGARAEHGIREARRDPTLERLAGM